MPTRVFLDANGETVDLYPGEIAAEAPADRIDAVLLVGATVSLGFLVVFSVAGPDHPRHPQLHRLRALGRHDHRRHPPRSRCRVFAGRDLSVTLPKAQSGPRGRQLRSMLTFGTAYAVASLSCTLLVFLAVVAPPSWCSDPSGRRADRPVK